MDLMAHRWIPDPLIRFAIRRVSAMRLAEQRGSGIQAQQESRSAWWSQLAQSPIALDTDAANEQHYEVPAEFFQYALGPRLKYSSAYFENATDSLATAEEAMLDLSCRRAGLANGQRILELGCGWGSLTLWMGEMYPGSQITAVSNSASQRAFILEQASRRGLDNIDVVTADMNSFDADRTYDRVVSIEMFEHMRNWPLLLERIAGWLDPDGLLFIHIFTHRNHGYAYEVKDQTDWMARYFFTGGQMPSADQLAYLQRDMQVTNQWAVSGVHYQRTSNAWLANMDAHRQPILRIFEQTYGDDATRWFQYWRVFFMACAELFGYNRGNEWFVSHYTMTPRPAHVRQPQQVTV